MDFSRQCKRFNNFTRYGKDHFKRTLANISAIGMFKNVAPKSTVVNYRFVVVDNDLRSIFVLNEADGELLRETTLDSLLTFGLCCTNKNSQNFIYVADYVNNMIRKFDENLQQVKAIRVNKPDLTELNGPTSVVINYDLQQLQVLDQKNCRVVCFDLQTDNYVSEIELFNEDLAKQVKYFKPNRFDLSVELNMPREIQGYVRKIKLDFWPFGLYTKTERIYVTDWYRGVIYVYKNGVLERRIEGPNNNNDKSKKFLSRPRDIVLDSLDSMLITDLDHMTFCFLDHKGQFMFETPVPKSQASINSKSLETGIFGVFKIESTKLVYATNCAIYILNLPA